MLEVYALEIEELQLDDEICSLPEIESSTELERSSSKKFDTDKKSIISVSTNIGRRDQNMDAVRYSII